MRNHCHSFEPQRTQRTQRTPTTIGVVLLCVLCVLCGSIPAAAQPRPVDKAALAQLDAYVAKAVKDWHAPGLAIAVVKDDSVVFAKGYGVRELGKPDAVDVGTRFAIGSTTKAMTVAALGMLVDEGKLKWDDPVTKYLPDFRLSDPWVTQQITVRDLLTHRTGLGNADLLWAGADYSTAEIIRRVRYLPLAYSPRSQFIYQNIMYAAAGQVVEAVAGMPWEQFLRTRIFTPLGMSATVPLLADLAEQPNVASPHAEIDDTMRVIQNRTVDPVKAAGSVWSSVGDMSKWMKFILDSGRVGDRRLLKAATVKEMLTPQMVADKEYPTFDAVHSHFFDYGLGFFLQDYAGQAIAMHTGSIDGMCAIIGLIPDKRLGVYVLENADHVELRHALMYQVFDMYLGNTGHDWSAELRKLYDSLSTQAKAAQQRAESQHATGTHPSLALDRYAGTYHSDAYGDVRVTQNGEVLHVSFGRAYDGDLSHWQYDTFRARWADRRSGRGTLVFVPDGTGGVGALKAFGATFTKAK
jgi:CubicO group peptidase (beta-lactamase class C family)